MSLNKQKMVREIGRRTRIRNRDVQAVIEALIEVWTEELVCGGRIELEKFLSIGVKRIGSAAHRLRPKHYFRQIKMHVSKALRDRVNQETGTI